MFKNENANLQLNAIVRRKRRRSSTFFFFFFLTRWLDFCQHVSSRYVFIKWMPYVAAVKYRGAFFTPPFYEYELKKMSFVTSRCSSSYNGYYNHHFNKPNTLNGHSNNIKSNLSILFYYIIKYSRRGLDLKLEMARITIF